MINALEITFNKLLENNSKLFFLMILIISISSLTAALIIESLGYIPCPLCIYQRFPYVALALFTLCGLIFNKNHKLVILSVLLIELSSIALSGYHSAIEMGWITGFHSCSKHISYAGMSLEEIRQSLSLHVADCSNPAILLFGLSIAQWNFIFNIMLLIISYNIFSKSDAKTVF